jgi:bacteriocin-like protein
MANINVSNLYPAIYDQPETAQIYEELSEEALASVAGGAYLATEGTILHW